MLGVASGSTGSFSEQRSLSEHQANVGKPALKRSYIFPLKKIHLASCRKKHSEKVLGEN